MIILIIFLLLIILTIVSFLLAYRFFKMSCKASNTSIVNVLNKSGFSTEARIIQTNVEWLKEQDTKDVYIKSSDGLKLHGTFLPTTNAYRTVICVHGYRGSSASDFSAIIRYLNANHSNVLLVDQRCHGESEGEYITFGAKEQDDIRLWTEYTVSRLDDKNPIYLYGVSMGASTCLLTLKNKLSYQVKGVIADCGYTSMEYICKSLAKAWYHLPEFPIINILKMYCSLIAGFNMNDTNVVNSLKENEIPILFVHGNDDTFVIPENTRINYSATKANKDILWVDGANHAESILKNPTVYHNKLEYFFNTYK